MTVLLLLLGACSPEISFEDFREAIIASDRFSGGPTERFEDVGRNTLATSIRYGLMPDDKVLDVGAGVLRVGWWLLQYIDAENYYVIEPNRESIELAASLIGQDIHIHYNDDWEFPDVDFDFVLARSIWTHASKSMISKMLAEFAENAAPDGRFLTSVRFPDASRGDYMREGWGKGMVRHSLGWIEQECRKHGLTVEVKEELHSQTWLLIEKRDPTGG